MPDPSPSNADSLNSNFLQLGRRSGGRPQRTVYTGRLPVIVNTVTHTTLAGLEPRTFRLLVRRTTSRATETTRFASEVSRLMVKALRLCDISWTHLRVSDDDDVTVVDQQLNLSRTKRQLERSRFTGVQRIANRTRHLVVRRRARQ